MAKTNPAKKPRNEPKRGASGNELLVYGDIGETFWGDNVAATDVAEFLSEFQAGDDVVIRINSFGGDAFEGVAIHNLLRSHPANVIVKIDGAAISAASVIAMAGDTVEIAESAMVMIHDPWTCTGGNAADFRETADMLDRLAGSLGKVYSRKTGQDDAGVRALMAAETWMDAAEALELGFVDTVTDGDTDVAAEEKVAAVSPIRPVATGPGLHRAAARFGYRHTPGLAQASADPQNFPGSTQPETTPTKAHDMDSKIMSALGLREDASDDAALKAIDGLKQDAAAKAALETQNAKLAEERDAAVKAEAELRTASITAEVKALVGVKFSAAEVDDQIQLAISNRELFDKLTEQRESKTLLNKNPAGIDKAPAPVALSEANQVDETADFINQAAASV